MHEQDSDYSIRISQDHYIKQLRTLPADIIDGKSEETELDESGQQLYMSLLGGGSYSDMPRSHA
eukprot:4955245-Amphidinium_carterae.1